MPNIAGGLVGRTLLGARAFSSICAAALNNCHQINA
jgi:hypothetical protein